jgi:2,6-dihydroxypyridine 3-monooxygenase
MPRVAVCGGSIGGLLTGLLLRDLGCDVEVFERSPDRLQAAGAGIVVLETTLRYFVERARADPEEICSATEWIRFVAADGSTVHERRHRYLYSSWNTIYRGLLTRLDADRYHLGAEVVGFADVGDEVEVRLGGGDPLRVDLLVCADGVGSASRQALFPDVSPRYAGYVAWRGTVPEAEVAVQVRDRLGDAITYQVLPNSHVLVYPIPGPDGAVEPGRRLINVVWYRNVPPGGPLREVLTDRAGTGHRVALPPGGMRPDAVQQLRDDATRLLAPVIAEVVAGIAEPFVQAIVDVEVPRMAVGRVCLIGDAAFAVRPHAAAGTAKAAADAWALAGALSRAGGEVPVALRRWDAEQVAMGRALVRRTREIGDSSQFTGGFTPGDPKLIFGLHEPGR